MQSAEELAHEVAKSVSDAIHTPIVLDIYGSAVDLIRARDREIVEVCKEAIIKAYDGSGRLRNHRAQIAALDGILSDLG